MQQMASRKSDALWSASKIKMRHGKISATENRQDAEVNITSCNGISFLVPWSIQETVTFLDPGFHEIKQEKFDGGMKDRKKTWYNTDRIPSTTPGAEPPRDARDSGSARSHSTHLETSSSNRP